MGGYVKLMGSDSDSAATRPYIVARPVHVTDRGKRLPAEGVALRNRRYSEAAARAQDRRDREDTAARLRAIVPEITSLELELAEFRSEGSVAQVSYRKVVVVARAPALFEIRCSDSDCIDGGHNLTSAIMTALRERSARFSGYGVCRGDRRNESCSRRLEYRGLATYRERNPVPPNPGDDP